ncbi:MAG: site-2 protease family protein [Firmicutes bacterium]|nr:site-2 protease family protein [Bacillota bacterium]
MRRGNIDISFIIIIILLAGSSFREGLSADPQGWILDKILIVPGIIIGLTFHEFAHAFMADRLGDNTPRMQGRVTLNPMAHIDWMGLAALFFVGFGWGQPVQINPYNFRKRRRDEFLVSIAGVAMNLLLAILFTVVAKIIVMVTGVYWGADGFTGDLWLMLIYIIQINLVLMIFNLIPVPPLDGFNIIAQIFNFGQKEVYWQIYRYGNWLLVILIITGITGMIISPCVNFLFRLLVNTILI